MALIEFILKIISICGYASIFILLVYSLKEKHINIGVCSTIFISVKQIYELLDEVFGRHISMMMQNMVNIKYYLQVISITTKHCKWMIESSDNVLEMKEVSFAYPNAIQDLSLQIKKGEVLAIVGYNGSGKSTLAKLLVGIYKPSKGKIFGNNTLESSDISAVFQNFVQYKLTVKDNVQISDFSSEQDISDVLRKIDFNFNELGNGIETLLGREMGGSDLSGGQWQRLAIARGIHRVSRFILLDEPNSAIDPFEEEKLYQQFSNIVSGKTAILITHRLNSIKIADRIIVMDKGKVTECGTHDELIKKNGQYAKMFEAQKQWYL